MTVRKRASGYFREVLRPRIEQFETIFTHEHGPLEGVSILLGSMSDPIIEHGHRGSMRAIACRCRRPTRWASFLASSR